MACGHSPISGSSPANSADSANSPALSAQSTSIASDVSGGRPVSPTSQPFSSHISAKICLRSALAIAQGFDNLPYPNPSGNLAGQELPFLSPTSSVIAPRTMPSFACCAMQSAYSLLMIFQRTQARLPQGNGNLMLVSSMLVQLQQGLTSISAVLENYATAFEALGGMRGEDRQ